MKIIAFRFCDNDFHHQLQESVEYVADHWAYAAESKTEEELKAVVVSLMVAYNTAQNIMRGRTNMPYDNYKKYFEDTLQVTFVRNMNELKVISDDGGEGYYWNQYRNEVYYFGY